MTTQSITTSKNSSQTFDVQGHINSRAKQHSAADIYNRWYPGLATIELNISELCNRTCSFCPRHDPEVYPNQKLFMDLELVEKLTKELYLSKWSGDIHITGFGEPHTHPHLVEIVRILSKNDNLHVEITTNGDRIIDTHPELAMDLWGAGLNMLTVDCYDGPDQYNTRKTVLEVLGPNEPWRLRQHYDTGNTEELIQQYGFNNRSGIMGGEGRQGTCYLPFYKAFIDWNGSVNLCCNDWHREAGSFGNLWDQPFHDIWNGEKMRKTRAGLASGIRKGVCANCNIVGTKFGEASFELLTRQK